MKILFLGLLLISSVAQVKAQKIGFYNSNELASTLPEVKKIDSQVVVFSKTLTDEYSYLKDEYDTKMRKLSDSASLKEIAKSFLKKDLSELASKLNDYTNGAQNKMVQKKNELLTPLLNKINSKVKEIAKEKGYEYVFDISQFNFAYADEKYNISSELKKRLLK